MKNPELKTALIRYMKTISILKKGYEQERYRIQSLCQAWLGKMRVRSIRSHHIAQYRDERLQQENPKTGRSISPSTVRLEMSLLSNFFEIARIEWGIVGENPVKNVRKPKPSPGRTRRLNPREESQIIRYCERHDNQELLSIFEFALESAMRQGEILSLRWEHINLTRRIAHLPTTKNGTSRDVPLSVKAKESLLRMGAKGTGRIFSYSNSGIKTAWRVMMHRLTIEDLKFHDLRHEAISRLFEKSSLDIMEIAAISGHKSLAMLKRYTHLKAHKLVKKLDGNKNKGRQYMMDQLNPYPAYIEDTQNAVRITVPDLDVCVSDPERTAAINRSQDLVLRLLVSRIKAQEKIPQPGQYLSSFNGELISIEPL
ncbi:MAG: site-specific integrase [Pedobacter sp.]